jgi:hypothetical protein
MKQEIEQQKIREEGGGGGRRGLHGSTSHHQRGKAKWRAR